MNQKRKDASVKRLEEKVKNFDCPACGTPKSRNTIIDGYHFLIVQPVLDKIKLTGIIKLTGMGVPYIALVCNNCGYARFFALKALLKEAKSLEGCNLRIPIKEDEKVE